MSGGKKLLQLLVEDLLPVHNLLLDPSGCRLVVAKRLEVILLTLIYFLFDVGVFDYLALTLPFALLPLELPLQLLEQLFCMPAFIAFLLIMGAARLDFVRLGGGATPA